MRTFNSSGGQKNECFMYEIISSLLGAHVFRVLHETKLARNTRAEGINSSIAFQSNCPAQCAIIIQTIYVVVNLLRTHLFERASSRPRSLCSTSIGLCYLFRVRMSETANPNREIRWISRKLKCRAFGFIRIDPENSRSARFSLRFGSWIGLPSARNYTLCSASCIRRYTLIAYICLHCLMHTFCSSCFCGLFLLCFSRISSSELFWWKRLDYCPQFAKIALLPSLWRIHLQCACFLSN